MMTRCVNIGTLLSAPSCAGSERTDPSTGHYRAKKKEGFDKKAALGIAGLSGGTAISADKGAAAL